MFRAGILFVLLACTLCEGSRIAAGKSPLVGRQKTQLSTGQGITAQGKLQNNRQTALEFRKLLVEKAENITKEYAEFLPPSYQVAFPQQILMAASNLSISNAAIAEQIEIFFRHAQQEKRRLHEEALVSQGICNNPTSCNMTGQPQRFFIDEMPGAYRVIKTLRGGKWMEFPTSKITLQESDESYYDEVMQLRNITAFQRFLGVPALLRIDPSSTFLEDLQRTMLIRQYADYPLEHLQQMLNATELAYAQKIKAMTPEQRKAEIATQLKTSNITLLNYVFIEEGATGTVPQPAAGSGLPQFTVKDIPDFTVHSTLYINRGVYGSLFLGESFSRAIKKPLDTFYIVNYAESLMYNELFVCEGADRKCI